MTGAVCYDLLNASLAVRVPVQGSQVAYFLMIASSDITVLCEICTETAYNDRTSRWHNL